MKSTTTNKEPWRMTLAQILKPLPGWTLSMVSDLIENVIVLSRESLVRDFKHWLKGRNINAREKDLIRGYLNSLTPKREEE